jgi:spermidine/putrescine transport system ATP-binding protein
VGPRGVEDEQSEAAPAEATRSSAAEPDIHLEGVTKRFGTTTAVDDLTLSIERGGFFAMLGPSGCGKTTTLRMIGGFEEPTAGTVRLGGRDVTNAPPYKRDVNTVFQSYALFPHLNVEKNVAFGLERKKVDKHEVTRRVGEMLELVQLGPLARRKPAQLSGGQQQRVALARALVNQPRALLLDEPLGALDLRLRRQLQIELKRIQQEIGITFVHVTHDQEEAMTMADRIAVMSEGRIEQAGDATALYEHPRTAFVAKFLGVSNLIDGTRKGADAFETHDGAQLRLAGTVADTNGAAVQCGVRPEKISLRLAAAGSPPTGDNVLRGQLTLSSFLGTAIQYLVKTAGGEELTVVEQNSGTDAALGPGQDVLLSWAPEHTFVVAKETDA